MASTAIKATGTIVQIETGTGSAKNITGVTVGNPTLLTSSAHGFADGDRVTIAALTGADAADLNGQVWTVQFKTTNTFCVAKDTTGKTITAGSGTATPVTFTAIGNAKSFSGIDYSTPEFDVTNFASAMKEFKPGLPDPGNLSIELDLDNADGGQAACRAALLAQTTKTFKVILPAGTTPTCTFTAFVKKFSISGKVDDAVRGQLELRLSGQPTWS